MKVEVARVIPVPERSLRLQNRSQAIKVVSDSTILEMHSGCKVRNKTPSGCEVGGK